MLFNANNLIIGFQTCKETLLSNTILQLLKVIRRKIETGKLLIESLSLQICQHKNKGTVQHIMFPY